MTPTRIDGFIVEATGNLATVDALEAISAQMEVARVALFAIGRECGIRRDPSFSALVTVWGDLHETLDSLKNHIQRVETPRPLELVR